ncbi:MAG: glycosyltransferase [Geobacter sp.]|nr:MAG: glycosyltransferase [Geobacter sp.]
MQISIITATYNAAATIADCQASVRAQTVPVEHLIIDGASTDNTLDIIERSTFNVYQSPMSGPLIYSEPDRGIYDAMNKGIWLATGDIIGILNSDDFYADERVLERVLAAFDDPSVMCCYGDLEYVKDALETQNEKQNFTTVRYWQSGLFSPGRFKMGWMPPHPTFFVRRQVYEQYGGFRLDMGSAADYELMLRLLHRHRIPAAYIPEVLVRMRVGGESNATLKNRFRANRMDRRAWEINGLKPYPWTFLLKPLRKVPQWFRRSGSKF